MDAVALALACYRTPLAYQDRLTLVEPLPEGMERLLKVANGSQEALDLAVIETGARPQELCEAARFCIQQWCFARGASGYRVLGLEPGASLTQAKDHHRLLMRLLHPDRAAGRETWTEGYAARVNQAWTLLSRTECHKDASDLPPPLRQAADIGISSADHWRGSSAKLSPHSAFSDTRKWFFSPRHRLSAQVLSGLAMFMILAGFYLHLFGKNQVFPIIATSPADDPGALPATPDHSAISTFLTTPDWRTLDHCEQQLPIQVIRHEQPNAHQALVQQVQARVEASLRERAQMEPLRLGEQSLVDQAQAEQSAAARLSLEKLEAEQAQPKLLALAHQSPSDQQVSVHTPHPSPPPQGGREFCGTTGCWPPIPSREGVGGRGSEQRLHQPHGEELKAQPVLSVQALVEKIILSASEATSHSSTGVNVTSVEGGELKIQALDDLVDRYIKAYQQGDLDRLMTLFAKHRLDSEDWRGIRQRYANLFRTHLIREFKVQDLTWAIRGESATGVARYQLSLRQRRDGGIRDEDGRIRFEVLRQGVQIQLINVIEQAIPTKSPNRTAGGAIL